MGVKMPTKGRIMKFGPKNQLRPLRAVCINGVLAVCFCMLLTATAFGGSRKRVALSTAPRIGQFTSSATDFASQSYGLGNMSRSTGSSANASFGILRSQMGTNPTVNSQMYTGRSAASNMQVSSVVVRRPSGSQ